MFTALRIAAAVPTLLLAALHLGPPSIRVSQVGGRVAAPVPGALFVIEAEHHHEAHAVTAHARLETIAGGRRHSTPLRLAVVTGAEGRWALTRQWPANQAAVLVLTIQQGEGGQYGTADALVRIAADGRVLGIERMMQTLEGRRFAGPATPKAIDDALAAATRGT